MFVGLVSKQKQLPLTIADLLKVPFQAEVLNNGVVINLSFIGTCNRSNQAV